MPDQTTSKGVNRKPADAGSRPVAVFAMDPDKTRYVFTAEHMHRLSDLCQLPADRPLQGFDGPDAERLLRDTEILITGWGCPRIDGAVLDRAPRLRLIAHAAGSVKRIVGAEVFRRGISVCHAAAANALPVAEYTVASVLLANKRIGRFHHLYTTEGGINDEMRALADGPIGNYRKRIGIVGASRIGRRVIELLQPFDLELFVYDPWIQSAEARKLGAQTCDLATVMGCDVVTLHAPLLDTTKGMIDADALARMPDGGTLINTARGAIVDQSALERELVSGRIDAVIDVTHPEVLPADSPLYRLPNVLITPHIAGAMGVERNRLGSLIVGQIERFVSGQKVGHLVNPDLLDREA